MEASTRRLKAIAHSKLGYAIRLEKFPRANTERCADCGKRAQQWDHHKGYATENIFIVEPVCCSCHIKRTYARGEKGTNSEKICGSKNGRWKGGISYDANAYQRAKRKRYLKIPGYREALNARMRNYMKSYRLKNLERIRKQGRESAQRRRAARRNKP